MPTTPKRWYKSRTVIANVLAGLMAGASLLAAELPDFKAQLSPRVYLGLAAGLAVLNVWLRMTTVAPIGKADEQTP